MKKLNKFVRIVFLMGAILNGSTAIILANERIFNYSFWLNVVAFVLLVIIRELIYKDDVK